MPFPGSDSELYRRALEFLHSRINYERTDLVPYAEQHFKLDRMRKLLAQLDDPHLAAPVVHIAGSKGKGSTATLIASGLTAHGLRTGLYTSPHLLRLEERMAVDGRPCTAEQLLAAFDRVRPVVERLDAEAQSPADRPTFFETTTALALVHFAHEPVDAMVLEVGLGGRLDSTNVCQPAVTVITSISFDHTRQLGNTLAAIAREKGGIIKPGIPLVTGVTEAEPWSVIEQIAADRNAPVYQLERDFWYFDRQVQPGGSRFVYAERDVRLPLSTSLLGAHQVRNASVAAATFRRLAEQGWNLDERRWSEAIASTRCAARVEVVAHNPTVVLDAAHNVASIKALMTSLSEHFPSPGGRVLIFASSRDKDIPGMLSRLLPGFETLILTRFQSNPRGVDPEQLRDLARNLQASGIGNSARLLTCPDPATAWQTVESLRDSTSLVCITGSFFLAAEIKALLDPQPTEFLGIPRA